MLQFLLTDAQLGDQGTVALNVLAHQVVQQLAPLTDHLVKTPAGVVVVDVDLQVLGQLVDPGGEDGDLYLRGAGIGGMGAVGLDDSGLFVFADHLLFHLSSNMPRAGAGAGESRKLSRGYA